MKAENEIISLQTSRGRIFISLSRSSSFSSVYLLSDKARRLILKAFAPGHEKIQSLLKFDMDKVGFCIKIPRPLSAGKEACTCAVRCTYLHNNDRREDVGTYVLATERGGGARK